MKEGGPDLACETRLDHSYSWTNYSLLESHSGRRSCNSDLLVLDSVSVLLLLLVLEWMLMLLMLSVLLEWSVWYLLALLVLLR